MDPLPLPRSPPACAAKWHGSCLANDDQSPTHRPVRFFCSHWGGREMPQRSAVGAVARGDVPHDRRSRKSER